MKQLLAFYDWERKHRPDEAARLRIVDWAYEEIVLLRAMLATPNPIPTGGTAP